MLRRLLTASTPISRRTFVQSGGLSAVGMTLPQLFASRAAQAAPAANLPESKGSAKACILLYMLGGPPQQETFDLKPEAPGTARSLFRPIATNVPGIEICELFPNVAQVMDKFIPVRSLSDSDGAHDCYQCMTGRRKGGRMPPGGWPSAGAWVSKLQGQFDSAIPANLALMYQTGNRTWGEPGDGGFLGVAHSPFNLLGRKARSTAENMVLHGITLDRLKDRTELMKAFDNFRRDADAKGTMESLDVYNQQAMGILTTSKLAEALDLSKEDPRILARYGKSREEFQRDGAPPMIENFCLARRLVEAGARFISLNYSRWDWHGSDGMNYPKSREEFPLLDTGLAALVSDIHERGLQHDVAVVVWGEFGRTPKINNNNSRDHWPQANACLLAGGGMRAGQVIGKTNRYGEHPVERPVKFQEVFATLYKCAGIDARNIRVFDQAGVPQYLVDPGIEPIHEVL
jgi:Protein of unknown function (DUF1501)